MGHLGAFELRGRMREGERGVQIDGCIFLRVCF